MERRCYAGGDNPAGRRRCAALALDQCHECESLAFWPHGRTVFARGMRAETRFDPAVLRTPELQGAPRPALRLDQAAIGRLCTVRTVTADPHVPERARQLEEIGFFPGEQVTVLTRGFPGGDPLVVRIGQSTFALRGAEAACIRVEPAGA
jgi:ferrous iron transport protein A